MFRCWHNISPGHDHRPVMVRLVLTILVPLLFASNLSAQGPRESTAPDSGNLPKPVPIPDVVASIDNVHSNASELIYDFASQVDNFLGDEIDEEISNNSSATVRMEFSNPSDDDFSTSSKLKLRLVLPRSKQRLRLLLDIDETENENPTEALTEDDTNQAVSLAFRFIRNASENTRFNIDVGARRFDQRLQGFARLRVDTKFQNDEGWSFQLKNDLRHYYISGYTNLTSLNFWRSINNDHSIFFRVSTNFNWERIQSGTQIDQRVGVYKNLRRQSFIALELLGEYNTSPEENESRYDGHTARIRYRKNAFRPWFHYELWPSISWLAENDRELRFGGLVRFEVEFGKL